MATQTELAYIAGIMDGEAYIGIKKSRQSHNGRVNPGYQERIQIRMVDEEAISFIANTLGGNYYQEASSVSKGRPLYCFQASDKLAIGILKATLPYLRVKRRVAEVVLALRELKSNPEKVPVLVVCKNRWGQEKEVPRLRLSPAHVSRCDSLYSICKQLNKVGI